MKRDSAHLSRRAIAKSMAAGLPLLSLSGAAGAANTRNPGRTWERFARPEDAGFRSSALEAMEQTLYPNSTTSLMVVKAGRLAYSYGDIAQVSYLASARKSVLSMLYGRHVANGTIDLKRTIGELGINGAAKDCCPSKRQPRFATCSRAVPAFTGLREVPREETNPHHRADPKSPDLIFTTTTGTSTWPERYFSN